MVNHQETMNHASTASAQPSRRQLLVALAALAPMMGCYGSFGLTKSLYGWNGSVSNKILRELVFLVFVIIPIYGITLFVDAFILNLIEFVTGTNPIASKDLGEGRRVAFERLPDQRTTRVVLTEKDQVTKVIHVRRGDDGSFVVFDENRQPLAAAETSDSGGLLLLDGQGVITSHISPAELRRIEQAAATRPLSALVNEALADLPTDQQVAARHTPARF